jgi:hypothetical protein
MKRKRCNAVMPHGCRVPCSECDKYFVKTHDDVHLTCEVCRTPMKERG